MSGRGSTYRAHGHVYANTYGEAIENFGSAMDAIWENGNWDLVSCEAEPHLYDNAGRIVMWRWEFEVRWLGQVR